MTRHVRKATAFVLTLSTLLVLPGCGVIFGGAHQSISLESTPDHSSVEFKKSGRTVVTPSEVSLERKGNYVLTFQKDGYRPHQAEITRHLRAGILVLDIVVGLVGVIVDAATGAWYTLKPERLDITLEKVDAAASGPREIHVRVGIDEGEDQAPTLRLDSDAPVTVLIREKR